MTDQIVPALPACEAVGEAAMRDWAELLVARARDEDAELTGEIGAQLAEIHDASMSRETISKTTDEIAADTAEWQNRLLDAAWIPVVVANV